MKKLIIIALISIVSIALFPQTANARWHIGFGIFYDDCDCYFGDPDPWGPWWECPCYWDVWEWCEWHPYWMWPYWCRRYVDFHYSRCGHYYYVYYDHYIPHGSRVFVDGVYRYRYAVDMRGSFSIAERIPRRSGLERPSPTGSPMPEVASRVLSDLGPEYRVKTVAAHAAPPSLRPNETVDPISNERPSASGELRMATSSIPVIGSNAEPVDIRRVEGEIFEKTSAIEAPDGAVTITRYNPDTIHKKEAPQPTRIEKPTVPASTIKSKDNEKPSSSIGISKSSTIREKTPSRSTPSNPTTSKYQSSNRTKTPSTNRTTVSSRSK